MLSLATVGRGRWGYYLETVASGRDEPGGLVEPDGSWLGDTAAALGLDGLAVDRRNLGALLEGVDPATGERLDPLHHRVRVAAYDCTFAAPKSVSLVHALASPDVVAEVRAAHEASVAGALRYLEQEAIRVRHRSGGMDRVVPTTGVAAAAFVHRTSRAPDPHLHSHVLVANLGSDGSGRWRALDSRPLFLNGHTAGAVYRAQLRAELVRRLDVAWRWRADGLAELAGVRPEVLRAFSRRHEEIAAALSATGRSGPRAARFVADASRPAKDLATPYEALVDSWRERAYVAGVSAGRIASVTPRRASVPRAAPPPPLRRNRAADPAFDMASGPFTKRVLVQARSQELHDGAPAASLIASVDTELAAGRASGEILPDPDRTSSTGSLRRHGSGHIPTRGLEEVLVTSEFLRREAALSRTLAAAPVPGTGRLGSGVYVLGTDGRSLLAAEHLAGLVARAACDGRPVVAVAPSTRRAAHLEALLGVEASGVSESPGKQAVLPDTAGALVAVGDADRWSVAGLAALVDSAERGGASVVLVPTHLGGGRRRLAAALERVPEPSAVEPSAGEPSGVEPYRIESDGIARDVAIRQPTGPLEPVPTGRPGVGVVLVDGPGELTGALLAASERQRATSGQSLVVVGDRAVASSLERATAGAVRVVTADDLRCTLADAPGAGLVVLGGTRLLGRALAKGEGRERVHVAVAPAGASPEARREWAARLAVGERARGRARDVGRARDIGSGLGIG